MSKLPEFLYEKEDEIYIGFHGDAICTKEWKKYIFPLKSEIMDLRKILENHGIDADTELRL